MSVLYGGQRARAIRSSVYKYLNDKLNTLGWFASGSNFTPVTFSDEMFTAADTAVAPNTLALVDGQSQSVDLEMGYYNGVDTWAFAVDLFAENDSVGLALIKDVQKILEGRMPNVGAGSPVIPLLDFTQATPSQFSILDVERVAANRLSGQQPWMKYWYTCHFDLVDYDYG